MFLKSPVAAAGGGGGGQRWSRKEQEKSRSLRYFLFSRSPAEEAKAAASSLCLQTYPVSQCGRINHFWTPMTTVPIAIYASDDSLSLGDQGTPGEAPVAAAAGGKMHFLLGRPAGAGPRIPGPDSQTPQAGPRPPRSLPSAGKALLAFSLPQIPEDKSHPPPRGTSRPQPQEGL